MNEQSKSGKSQLLLYFLPSSLLAAATIHVLKCSSSSKCFTHPNSDAPAAFSSIEDNSISTYAAYTNGHAGYLAIYHPNMAMATGFECY